MSLAATVKFLELMLSTEVEEYFSIFMDAILVVSKSFNEHIKHPDKVFKKLWKANIVMQPHQMQLYKIRN